jgi:hypothetical protein
MKKLKMLLFGAALAALLAVPGAAMAKSHDRDHDKLPDKWEHKFHLSTHHKSGKGDPDKDGLNNRGEFKSKTNPRRADSDRDGVNDANDDQDDDGVDNVDEQREHTNPCDADSDNDGTHDGDEVLGTVDSFVEDSSNPGTGVLTITLADNTKVSGKVGSDTEIECRTPRTAGDDGMTHERHDGGDERGDDDHSGPGRGGDAEGDDDHGDRGDDGERQCTTADLTPGTSVHEAELQGSGAGAVFEEVKLLK